MPQFNFRVARESGDLEQVHSLHYKAFVEEIPQHSPNDDRRHIDRFHDENVYIVAMDGERLIGSLAVRSRRPFSLDAKLPNLDAYLPPNRSFCELRLLSIAKEHRTGAVLPGLIAKLAEYAAEEKFDCALISATTRQLRLYGHLGFVPFGPLVGTEEASFQPMYLTAEAFRERAREIAALPPAARGETVNLLPGPVGVHREVVDAFQSAPQSHRSTPFDDDLRAVKNALCALAHTRHVQVLLGSGTLANDTVAAQLSGRGVVLSNGEFGERLADHASRAQLDFTHLSFAWGEPIDEDAVRRELASKPTEWLWLVACETSTGVLNDVAGLAEICREYNTKLCLDCVSALGAVPMDLSEVWLATGASGKALASYPGLSLVFHREPIAVSKTLPRYLDLGLYARDGVPFTHSSNLVRALRVAVERVDWPEKFADIVATGTALRGRLRAANFTLIGDRATPAPHVITIALPQELPSHIAATSLERSGFLLAHASNYLRERNWVQICLMGEVSRDALPVLVRELGRVG